MGPVGGALAPEIDRATYGQRPEASVLAIGADFAAGAPGGVQASIRGELQAQTAAIVEHRAAPSALELALEQYRQILNAAALARFGAGGPHSHTL